MKYVLILLTFILAACGPQMKLKKIYSVPADVEPFVEAFRSEGATRGYHKPIDDLVVVFTHEYDGRKTLATCTLTIRSGIKINTTFWASANPVAKEQLIFHEMGHCVLGRMRHDDNWTNIFTFWMPESIMNKHPVNDYLYNGFRPYYLDELFGVL